MRQEGESQGLSRRVSDMLQYLVVTSIVGLVIFMIDIQERVISMEGHVETNNAISAQQITSLEKNVKLQLEVLTSLVDRVTKGGFDANSGNLLTQRVESNERRLDRMREAMSIQIARIDENIRRLMERLDRTEIGKMGDPSE